MSQPIDEADSKPRVPGELAYLIAASAAMAAAVVLLLGEQSTGVDVPRGAYAILVAVFVFAGIGYHVRSAEARLARLLQQAVDDRSQGLDEHSIDAARRINMRLAKTDDRG